MIWKRIPGIDSLYEVSDTGAVRRNSPDGYINISPQVDRCGYYRVSVKLSDGKKATIAVHRLVAKAFIPNPYNYPLVHHIDEVKTNNNKSNLLWCTHQQNSLLSCPSRTGAHAKRPYRILQLTLDGQLIAIWNTYEEAKRAVGVADASLISRCCQGKSNKSAYGYRWKLVYIETEPENSTSEYQEAFDLFEMALKTSPQETVRVLQLLLSEQH